MSDSPKRQMPWLKDHQFKKGQSGNSLGTISVSKPTREQLRAAKEEFSHHVGKLALTPVEEILKKLQDKTITGAERVVLAWYSRAFQGDMKHIDKLVERIMGPMPRATIIAELPSGDGDDPMHVPQEARRGLLKLMAKLNEIPEQEGDEPCRLIQELSAQPEDSSPPSSSAASSTGSSEKKS